jgi:hypothetical protein
MRKIGGVILLLALVVGIVIPAFAYTFLWPEFRGNAFRNGQGPSDVFGPENPVLAWNWGNGGRLGIPVVRESGDVYLGTEQNSVIGLRADGSLSFTYQAVGPVFYPPALMTNGMVFVSGDPDGAGDTHLEMYINGGQSWTYTPTIGRIVTAPLVDGSTSYFGTVETVPEGTREYPDPAGHGFRPQRGTGRSLAAEGRRFDRYGGFDPQRGPGDPGRRHGRHDLR